MNAKTEPRNISFDAHGFERQELIDIYKHLLLPRLIEEKMLILLRQGKITKWFSSWGQEAVSVGTTYAMHQSEYILPMHRNLGVFTTRNIPLERLFAQFQGKKEGFTKGRDRSFHFGSKEHKIVGMISHLGPQMGIADGIALAAKLNKQPTTTLVFTGDGGASEGDFHEAINVASVWNLPVIFAIENNQWGLSTPSNEQFKCRQFIDKAIGYGIKGVQVDGNNVLEVIRAVRKIRKQMIAEPQPILLELMTFRMRGHEEASGTKYYPPGLQEKWKKNDPIDTYTHFLKTTKVLTDTIEQQIKAALKNTIQQHFDRANALPTVKSSVEEEINDVYAPFDQKIIEPNATSKEMRFIDAIQDALKQSMHKYPDLILMGQDIAEYGGAFKVTEGFVEEFGKDRVRNTPLCESAIIGAGLGLSIAGMKSVIEMQFADFVTCGFNQIINNVAKIHWRWQQNADIVIRMPTGANTAAGPFHSQSNEAWFFHTPGLKIVYPSTPQDAKGLLNAAIEDPNPVLFFEHKYLYRSMKSQVSTNYFTTPIGKARKVRKGNDLTVITYGLGVLWMEQYLEKHAQISVDLIDLRSLMPLDTETVFESVKRTGKVMVLHEDCLTGGIGGELVALITENCFEWLDAPVKRVASIDTPVPFASTLEQQFLPQHRIDDAVRNLIEF